MTGTNYQKLVAIFATELEDLYSTVRDVKTSHKVETSRGTSLDNIGALLDYNRVIDELDADYRKGITTLISINSAAGTKPAIKTFLANYLRTSESEIDIREDAPNYIQIQLHTDFSPREPEVRLLVQRFIAAGVHVKIVFGGVYWDTATWDNDKWG